ncbi:LolA family protein [Streptacidiphilus carbonis]|uniref:LolA family protein n=1 Tax=Streptacidiphilus carbonis TaxID=105422 RepID=UPI00069451C4|nr:hypothetical protein [Streptacidiphilus carbonis]
MTNDDNGNANGIGPVRIPPPGAGQDLPGAATAAEGIPRGRSRRRVLIPAAIAVVAVAGVAAVPALAASSDLPSVTAQQLLTKMLSSRTQTFSGTVQAKVDLGIPSQIASAIPSAVAGSGGSTGQASQAQLAEKQLVALVSGGTHSFQVAADGQERQLVSSTDSGSAFTLVHNGSSAWAYDAQGKSATHVTGLGSGAAATQESKGLTDPQQAATQALAALGPSTTVSVAGTSKVAGHAVYELSVKPKGSGSTIGEVRIAVDADNGLPLQVRVNPSDGSDSILNIGFSKVSFATPAAGTFAFTPPSGTKVVQQSGGAGSSEAKGSKVVPGKSGADDHNVNTIGTGWSTIYRFDATAGGSAASGKSGASDRMGAIKSFGKQVPGGTLISTKLVNVLVTDKGTVYAGAVTPALLEQAAK